VVFTTYALSLSFFEAIVLDRLTRGGGNGSVILCDSLGVRGALSERGATRVGRDYEIEPVVLSATGHVFHPKVSVFSAKDDTHLLVGSGNLTFGGWGGNLELSEHLHPSFAADAIADAADFFEQLSSSARTRHSAKNHCAEIADILRRSASSHPRNPDIRLFHNIRRPLLAALNDTVDQLGGATRLTAVSPFWDAGNAIDSLANELGIGRVFVHNHGGGTVLGSAGFNWPWKAKTKVSAVEVDDFSKDSRRLHAKAFEIVCRRGRILVSGSPNATSAAMLGRGNIEVCVVRIQRGKNFTWSLRPSNPPSILSPLESEPVDVHEEGGVLSAVLDGDTLAGHILAPRMIGEINISQHTSLGLRTLGSAKADDEGHFRLDIPGLELESWKGAQLLIRVDDKKGRHADGFVSLAAFSEIARRTGPIARRLFALLAGNETPSDVAAIMSWFNEEPSRLALISGDLRRSASAVNERRPKQNDLIDVSTLRIGSAGRALSRPFAGDRPTLAWRRFMDHIGAAFRERRGPIAAPEKASKSDDDDSASNDSLGDDPSITRSLDIFDKLFSKLLASAAPQHRLLAHDLCQYICERLRPDPSVVASWLARLVEKFAQSDGLRERTADVAASIVTLQGHVSGIEEDRRARARLLRLGWDVAASPPPKDRAQGFQSVLSQSSEWASLWERIQAVRTYEEQIEIYIEALRKHEAGSDYCDLLRTLPDEATALNKAITSVADRDRLIPINAPTDACPLHNRILPTMEYDKLLRFGVATAGSCCQRIIIVARAGLWPI